MWYMILFAIMVVSTDFVRVDTHTKYSYVLIHSVCADWTQRLVLVVFVSYECLRGEYCMPIWQCVAQGKRWDLSGKGDWRTQREEVCAPADGGCAREQTRAPEGIRARVRSREGLQGPLLSLIAPTARARNFLRNLHTQVHISVLNYLSHQQNIAHLTHATQSNVELYSDQLFNNKLFIR